MPRCPGCFTLMTREKVGTVNVHACPGCFGKWMQDVSLQRLVQQPQEGNDAAVSLQDIAAVVAESNTTKKLHCPTCPNDLEKDRFHPLIPVEIDRCPKCKGIYLDVGELPLLQHLWTELQNSDDPQIVRLRDKIAGINLDRELRRQDIQDQVEEMARMGRPRLNDMDDVADFTLFTLVKILSRGQL